MRPAGIARGGRTGESTFVDPANFQQLITDLERHPARVQLYRQGLEAGIGELIAEINGRRVL